MAALGLAGALADAASFQFGANVNEGLTRLDPALLDQSHTTWVRGFLPASEFITGKRTVTNDAGIQTLQRCAKEGRKVIASIKWDFKEARWAVPTPESQREKECFAFVDELLDEMRGQIAIFALVNEVFVDTLPTDLQPGDDGVIPMVRFLQRLAAHVHARADRDPEGNRLRISCGGFTRLDTPEMQTAPAALALMDWCESDPRIAIVNYHLHQRDYDQWRQSLEFIRKKIPTKPLIVTEFSMVWAYKAHLGDRLDSSEAGRAFADRHSLAGSTTVREYLNRCLAQPVSEVVWQEFLHSQSWFDPDFLRTTGNLMEQHGVIVATYAFSQHSSGGNRPLRENSTPWMLNPIFIPNVALPGDPRQAAVNIDWFAEYVRRQTPPTPSPHR